MVPIISILIIVTIYSNVQAIDIISSPRITTYGTWGSWQYCPNGTYATAFQLKVEGFVGAGMKKDDTALNGIALFCNKMGGRSRDTRITSKVGAFGKWGTVFDCHTGIITGFQLRSEGDAGTSEDDTAANNLRVFCAGTDSKAANEGIEGDGLSWGSWTHKQKCFPKQAVCGIRTEVEDDLGVGKDDTSLNNVDMACCDIPSEAETCAPSDKWIVVISCDNSKGLAPISCTYSKTRGVTKGKTSGQKGSIENEISTQIGMSIGAQFKALQASFSASLSTSQRTGFEWTTESSESFTEQTTSSAEFSVPAGMISELRQVVGYCGDYTVYSTHYKKVDKIREKRTVTHFYDDYLRSLESFG